MRKKETNRPATILDVASAANVAVGTVSRYLNGHSIRKTNRLRIDKAIQDLKYQANSHARAMKTERTNTIAFVVPTFDEFNSRILTELVSSLRERGYSLITFHHSDNPATIGEALLAVESRKVDGVILSGALEAEEATIRLAETGRPIVLYNNDIRGMEIDRVLVDNVSIAAKAVGHMIEKGHRRIGIVTGDLKTSTGQERLEGYTTAMRDAGLPLDDDLIFKGYWRRIDGYAAVEHLLSLDDPATALFASSHVLAEGSIEAMKSRNLQPGRGISMVSFDDAAMFKLLTPAITAIAQPTTAIAQYLTDLILSRLSGDIEPASRTIVVHCDFIVRESVENLNS